MLHEYISHSNPWKEVLLAGHKFKLPVEKATRVKISTSCVDDLIHDQRMYL